VSANDGQINQQIFQIPVTGEMLKQLFKDALIAPPIKAAVNGIPFTVNARKQSLLCARTSNPQNGFKKATHIGSRAEADFGKGSQRLAISFAIGHRSA
jgi:hypothetical protein